MNDTMVNPQMLDRYIQGTLTDEERDALTEDEYNTLGRLSFAVCPETDAALQWLQPMVAVPTDDGRGWLMIRRQRPHHNELVEVCAVQSVVGWQPIEGYPPVPATYLERLENGDTGVLNCGWWQWANGSVGKVAPIELWRPRRTEEP